MTTYKTGNPIGSTAVKDLYDNAENLDVLVNDKTKEKHPDRLGQQRKTWHGMEQDFNADQIDRQNRFNNFIASSGYQFLGDYAAGIEITEYNQIVRDSDGEFWRLSGQVELPYTTTGAGLPEDDSLTPLGDAVLRQELADPDKGSTMVGFRQAGPGAVGRSVDDKLKEYVSVKDFGAVGDGKTDDTSAIQAALDFAKGGEVVAPPGVYLVSSTIRVPSGTVFRGVGPLGGWRAAPFSNIPASLYENTPGVTLLLTGTGPKVHTLDYVTASSQCGYDRENPEREYNSSFDEKFELADFTNRDASGTTPATLRNFSVGVLLGDGTEDEWHQTILKNIRIVPSCPGDEEDEGILGYGDQTSIRPWSHWDVGVWGQSTWFCKMENCQVVGYYDIRGALFTSMANNGSGSQDNANGYAEFSFLDGCKIQGGLAVRSGDLWPILSKTSNSITIEWTSSHRFSTSGTLLTSDGSLSYTGLSFNSGQLTFTGTSDTSSINVTTGSKSFIRLTNNAGFANSTISRCEISDFSHATRVEPQSIDFGNDRLPFRAALEISGEPMRGIKFMNCLVFGNGPVMYHFGHARDIEFYGCYCEPKGYRTSITGPSQLAGALFICGPHQSKLTEIGNNYTGNVTNNGQHFVSYVSRAPLVNGNSERRLGTYQDAFHPRYFFDDRLAFASSSTSTPGFASNSFNIQGVNGFNVNIYARTSSGEAFRAFQAAASGNTYIGEGFVVFRTGNARVAGSFTPENDNSSNLGIGSSRWAQVFAANGTINTSDEREKEQQRQANEAEKRVAAALKSGGQFYKWIAAVEKKGNGARWHYGWMAQDVVKAFAAEGLDAHDYGMLCYDNWDETPEIKEPILDDEGNETGEFEIIQEYQPAGNRYGIRYDQLLAFIISAL